VHRGFLCSELVDVAERWVPGGLVPDNRDRRDCLKRFGGEHCSYQCFEWFGPSGYERPDLSL
jgi:hypothetical protein